MAFSCAGGRSRTEAGKAPRLVDERLQALELARAMDHRVRSENLLDERRARARHAEHEDRQVRPRALIGLRLEKRGREDLRDARHPALVRVRIVGIGRALEPVALVVVAERRRGVADVEERLAESEMERRAIGERDPLALEQRLHSGDQRIAPLEALEVGLAEQDPRRIGEGLGGVLERLSASALRPNSMNSAPRLAIASCCAGPGKAAARS